MTRKSNRREFLKGKVAAETLAGAILPDTTPDSAKCPPLETPTVHVTRRAMATEFELRFPDDPGKNFTELALESFEILETIEEQLSIFRPTSEISRINLLAARQPVEVEPALFDLLMLAMQLFHETGGAWDLTSTPLWQVWGFAKRKGKIPAAAEIDEAMRLVGSRHIQLDTERKTIFFRPARHEIEFRQPRQGICFGSLRREISRGGDDEFPVARRTKRAFSLAAASRDQQPKRKVRHPLFGRSACRTRFVQTDG